MKEQAAIHGQCNSDHQQGQNVVGEIILIETNMYKQQNEE
jgi:hypothetical protein